jgi:hypothetical protein
VHEPSEEISPFDVGHTVGLFDGSETLGYLKLQPPMRASPVVVPHIDRKDAIEMPGAEDQQPQSRHSARSVSIQRSAKAFAFGALIGVRITRIPSDTKTVSKERQNLASRSRMRKSICVPSSARLITRFLACWVTNEESGLVVETVTCTRRIPISMKNRT